MPDHVCARLLDCLGDWQYERASIVLSSLSSLQARSSQPSCSIWIHDCTHRLPLHVYDCCTPVPVISGGIGLSLVSHRLTYYEYTLGRLTAYISRHCDSRIEKMWARVMPHRPYPVCVLFESSTFDLKRCVSGEGNAGPTHQFSYALRSPFQARCFLCIARLSI